MLTCLSSRNIWNLGQWCTIAARNSTWSEDCKYIFCHNRNPGFA